MEKQDRKFLLKYGLTVMVVTAIVTALIVSAVYGTMLFTNKDIKVYNKFKEISQIIQDKYLFPYDEDQLVDMSLKGLVAGLGDPYSAYLDKDDLEQRETMLNNGYVGIGIEAAVDKEDNLVTVVSIIEGGPAQSAGLQPNDKIIEINGENVAGQNINDVTGKLKNGSVDEEIQLVVMRSNERVDISVKREKVEYISIKAALLEDGIGYIRITTFNENTDEKFTEAIKSLEQQGAKRFILDVRNNGGGLVDSAKNIADLFIDDGLLFYTQDKNGNRKEYEADHQKENYDKIIVLMNGNSASASELLTGALKDHGAAVTMGEKTFGKGIIQSMLSLGKDYGIVLTTEEYYTPNGNQIHKAGIEPDIQGITPEGEYNSIGDLAKDSLLQKAVAEIKK